MAAFIDDSVLFLRKFDRFYCRDNSALSQVIFIGDNPEDANAESDAEESDAKDHFKR